MKESLQAGHESPLCALPEPSVEEASKPDGPGLSRRSLLGLAGAVAASTLLAGGVRADILDTLRGVLDLDPIVLNFAHELEELQSEFFLRLTASPAYSEMEARERSVISAIAMQDRAHFEAFEALRGKLGARGGGHFESQNAANSRRPRIFRFSSGGFNSRAAALTEAVTIKENAVAAYHGAVDLLRDKRGLLKPAVAVAGVEGRHLAILRELAGLDPVPASYELQVSPQIVGRRLAVYGFRGGAMSGGQI